MTARTTPPATPILAATVTRQNVDHLAAADLDRLKAAYKAIQHIFDNRGFNYIAGFHGIPGNYCEHSTQLFLPWHRAYVYHLEQHLRDIDPLVSVPYWDWTSADTHANGVPAAFRNSLEPDTSPNPLFSFHARSGSDSHDTIRHSLAPSLLANNSFEVTEQRLRYLQGIDDFADFSSELEQKPHNGIHNWTGGDGGDMSDQNWAGYDPIFYSHHCMIDRLWHLWQQEHGVDNFPKALFKQPLQPFNLTVEDVLGIAQLGYNYA